MGKKPESEIARITLTPEAESRIGLVLAPATLQASPKARTVGGDVVPSSGRSIMVVAPVAGRLALPGTSTLTVGQAVKRGDALLRLTPVATVDRDLKATAGRTVSVAESRLGAMDARLSRAEKLLADGAGSARAVEEARADRDTAKAELDAAKSRVGMLDHSPLDSDVAVTLRAPEDGVVRSVSALPSSMVPAGAPLLELVGTGALWVRANVFVGDLRAIRHGAAAHVRPLTAKPSPADLEALPIEGPPTSDPLTTSFDLYYSLPKGADFRPGERVAVSLTYGDDVPSIHVPESAIVRDVTGTAWVYQLVGEHAFERRRVEVLRVDQEGAQLGRGLTAGAQIVATGAVELYGAEFGMGK
ncbi:putative Co/Zn/Cd efflux system membrane fusion protein [Labilithrix luteola]|uniref:Putative Co/Zn/Cd efflux system membrane fusion protein n=1 Tax=Labilithrix luteola TaxID=1391654 RepID=A0A0K1PW55_9BACT|nr:putative Co/Zn/Cd efflux system membrane fusion protein [Labilithrix luteola]